MYQKVAEAAELIEDKRPYYKYTPTKVLKNVLEPQHTYG